MLFRPCMGLILSRGFCVGCPLFGKRCGCIGKVAPTVPAGAKALRVPIGGELASAPRSFRSNLVFGRSRGIGTMMQHAHRRQSSERRTHSTVAAPGPWAEAGHRHSIVIGTLAPGSGDARRTVVCLLSQIVACTDALWYRAGRRQLPTARRAACGRASQSWSSWRCRGSPACAAGTFIDQGTVRPDGAESAKSMGARVAAFSPRA
jgi:hypothetical protein